MGGTRAAIFANSAGVRTSGRRPGSMPAATMASASTTERNALRKVFRRWENAADTVRGKCRMLVVPQRGRTLCLGSLDPARADAMLATIAEAARA